MEDIVHFKQVMENYYTRRMEEITHSDWDLLPFDDTPTTGVMKIKVTEQPTEVVTVIDQDEFKKEMSQNKCVSTNRTTYVVSEDLTKNTISFKCFKMGKTLVPVKNLKRKKFKIIEHSLFSLTVNKTTGEFSTYLKKYNRRKYYYTIRKNIITEQLKNQIRNYLSAGNNDCYGGVQKFYELLGYKPLTMYRDFMNEYLPPISENYYDPRITDSISSFPFLNYLFKSGIKDLTYEYLHMFEFIFKLDKKRFYNRSIFDYIRYRYGLKSQELYDYVISELKKRNADAWRGHPTAYHESKAKHSYQFYLPGINVGLLEMISKYNIPPNEFKKLPLITTSFYFDFTRQYSFDTIPFYIHKMVDYYGFNIVDVLLYLSGDHEGVSTSQIKALMYFQMFGVKLKIREPKELIDWYYTGRKIYDALCIARGATGTFQFNNTFVIGLKKLIPDGMKLVIEQGVKPTNETVGWSTPDITYQRKYDDISAAGRIVVFDKDDKTVLSYKISDVDVRCIRNKSNEFGEKKIEGIQEIVNYITYSQDNNKIFLKQIYSKQYFEKILYEEFGLKADEFLVYTN